MRVSSHNSLHKLHNIEGAASNLRFLQGVGDNKGADMANL